ncbi:winged helix-turn-helix transcriptional regulator [Klebsiella grimontii]|uniref:winged helix-turn-helix transcriptional regulator n=1 Tax=Klebsiella grimontii TaxID=2058152 RepID=UPI001CCBCADE|nr:winged helix-turn-helix transcriptional regulator [Klebsiella grimontii]MBZ7673760.1 cytoplasmic protein [Klebsiella grimontii]
MFIIDDDDFDRDSLRSFSFGRNTKPLLATERIFNALLPVSTPYELQPDNRFEFCDAENNANILLLSEGTGVVCHSENNMAITTLFSPSILGLIDGYSTFYDVEARPKHFFSAESHCYGRLVPLNSFVKIMDEQNHWHDIARILAHRLLVMAIREKEFIGVESFIMIRTLILELGSYPDEYREQINVLNFIQRRTNLSRSRILFILSELRKGDYISVNRGVLMGINKRIPTDF